MWESFIEGIFLAFRWDTFGFMSLGLMLGMFVGALQGFTTVMAMALMLPLSFFMDPLVGIPFLIGVYKGGIYGDSIPAILIGVRALGRLSQQPSTGRNSPKEATAAKPSKWLCLHPFSVTPAAISSR